ncbi:MAG: 5'-methylthioadenosine/S-adenosylhomocysteine nucleosidase [Devosia sp.]
MFGILCATPEELTALQGQLGVGERSELHGPTRVWFSTHDGRELALALSGIGKVNAAAAATLLLSTYGAKSLIFSGVAGGLNPALGVGSVLLGERLSIHDYGIVSGRQFTPTEYGVIPIGAPRLEEARPVPPGVRTNLARLRETMAGRLAKPIELGAILTADHFLNCAETRDELRAAFKADAVDMESGAVNEIANAWNVPLYVIRTLSDLAGDDSHLSYAELAGMAAHNSALCVAKLIDLLDS